MNPSLIRSPIDYDRDGKQSEFLRVPISADTSHCTTNSAHEWITIPVTCMKNGVGPTAVLIAGTHGDEYEGQIALMRLLRALEPEALKGRIIILPSLNFPAVQAGSRVSPIDEGNLNRVYPGRARGTATEMIAHYVTEVLLPMADLAVDLHSGGRSSTYLPCALARPGKTVQQHEKLIELLNIFGAPITYLIESSSAIWNATTVGAAERTGVPLVTTELGGGATLNRIGVELAEQGVLRLLKHIGILPSYEVASPSPVQWMTYRGLFLCADTDGLFEPSVELGEEVSKGQLAALIHSIDEPSRPPEEVRFSQDGMVVSKRTPTLVKRGDQLFELLEPGVSPSVQG